MTLGTQETANLEFKREARDRNAIREAICALANDLPGVGGGHLIIGVDKSGKPVREIDTSDQALLGLTSIRDEGRILDRPSMVVSQAVYQGQPVIQIEVSASRTPPVRFDNVDRVNDYRNPSLAAAMKSLGYVNQFGRGIGRIRAALRRNGNPGPGFVVDDASWTVTLRSTV